jgi:hypothetical protein
LAHPQMLLITCARVSAGCRERARHSGGRSSR